MTGSTPHKSIESALLTELASQGFSKSWIQAVQRLSNHYVAEPDSISPWRENWAKEALLSYYHPLNQARAERVANKGQGVGFFQGIRSIIDVGCGSGAASLGFLISMNSDQQIESLELSDHSREITEIAKRIVEASTLEVRQIKTSHHSIDFYENRDIESGTLLLLSYVLTESGSEEVLDGLLRRNPGLEAIAILEPSTSQDARRLQRLRPVLIRHGFSLWAPCTHENECPLLKDSDRDWCHDRVVPKLPAWWDQLESGLPMKNKTVTVSYLLARRSRRPHLVEEVRVIGDRMDEKTKIRQMICRGENREFISWFPSRLKAQAEDFDVEGFHLARGDRFDAKGEIWKDPRGIDRSKEFRLDLESLGKIDRNRLD